MRLASNGNATVEWLAGGFFQHIGRHYGQDLPTPGYDAVVGDTSQDFGTPAADTPFFPTCTIG